MDWIKTISRGAAGSVLVIVDGVVSYGDTIAATVTEPGWATGRLLTAPGTTVAYLFGELTLADPSTTLARAVIDLLADGVVPANLDQLEHLLRHRLARPGRGAGIAGRYGCSLHAVQLCDPRRFHPFPAPPSNSPEGADHEWVAAARRHVAFPLTPEGAESEQLRAITLGLVARLGAERDRHAAVLTEDPWREPDLATRMTRRVEFLLTRLPSEPPPLSSTEAAVLVAVPFLYETLWTVLVAEASAVEPARLDFQGTTGDRLAFASFAKLYPRLLRRAERARQAGDPAASVAIGWWLLHQWVAKARPESYVSGALSRLLVTVAVNPLAADVFRAARIAELLKALRSEPAFLGRTDRPGALRDLAYVAAATPQETPLRERLTGYLLAVGQRMAIEPAALPEVVAEHLGVADPVDLGDLRDTIRRAEWQQRGRTTRALAATCRHQAVQVALERHTATLDALLAEAHRTVTDTVMLAALPTHATADNVTAETVGGRQIYSAAGAQFRMAEDKVQELLMGEQLYATRGLAVRELYQNALDACRYRRAREEYRDRTTGERSNWRGRIQIRQGFEPDGRAYLDCEDNGIGMGMRELTDVFAEAGTRSVDMPEVVEEMARWEECSPPVEFYPNSRFGVGVLSYFMIADEITIDTCRVGLDGEPGRRLRVTIAGPGNLFRVQDLGPGRHGGTTVRLHLSRRPGEAPISSADILQRILWIAEFETSATEGAVSVTWQPGKLAEFAPVGNMNPLTGIAIRLTDQVVKTDVPVWWCNGRGAILADGLWVGTTAFGFVVNLTGRLVPEIAVDRNKIREFNDEPAVDALIMAAVPVLITGGTFEISMEWLTLLSKERPLIADAVQSAVLAAGDIRWRAAGGTTVPVSAVGCLPIDGEILEQTFRPEPTNNVGYDYIPDFVVFDRISCWRNALHPDRSRAISGRPAWPSDGELLGADLSQKITCDLTGILFRSGRLRRSPLEIADRLRWLRLVPPSLKGTSASKVTPADMRLLSTAFDGKFAISGERIPLGHAIAATQQTGQPLQAVVHRYQELGLRVDPAPDESLTVEPLDQVLLSRRLDGQGPWMESLWVSSVHLLRAALHTGRPVDDVRRRFSQLGYQAPPAGAGTAHFSDVDLMILRTEYSEALGESPLSLGFVYLAAAETSPQIDIVMDSLRALGFPVARSLRTPGDQSTRRLSSVEKWSGHRRFYQSGTPVSRQEIMWTAKNAGRTPREVAQLVNSLGFTTPALAPTVDAVWQTLDNKEVSELRNLLFMQRVSFTDILGTAHVLNRAPADVADILTTFGVASPDIADIEVTNDDALLISKDLDSIYPWLGPDEFHSSVAHVLAVAVQLKRRPAELATRLRFLGVPVADPDGSDIVSISPSTLLPMTFRITLDSPLLSEDVIPVAHVLRAAGATGRRPANIATELRKLGFEVERVTDAELTHEDDLALSLLLSLPDGEADGGTRFADPGVAGILATAIIRRRDAAEVAEWAESMGIRLPARRQQLGGVKAQADDLVLLSHRLDGSEPWLPDGVVPIGHVLAAAGRTGRSPAAVADRLRVLGVENAKLSDPSLDAVDSVDLVLLSCDLSGREPWLTDRAIPLAHVLHAACVLGCDVEEVVARYQRLGFGVPTSAREVDDQERSDLTVALYGTKTAKPEVNRITVAQVLGVAEYSGRPPAEVARRLADVGLAVTFPDVLADVPVDRLTPQDALLLSAELNGKGPWLDDICVPLAHIIAAASHLRREPAHVTRRLGELGCVVPVLVLTAKSAFIDGVDRALVDLLKIDSIGYVHRPISRAEVLAASFRFGWTPVQIADRLVELGFSVPCRNDVERLRYEPTDNGNLLPPVSSRGIVP